MHTCLGDAVAFACLVYLPRYTPKDTLTLCQSKLGAMKVALRRWLLVSINRHSEDVLSRNIRPSSSRVKECGIATLTVIAKLADLTKSQEASIRALAMQRSPRVKPYRLGIDVITGCLNVPFLQSHSRYG